jgi:hypothetical protein
VKYHPRINADTAKELRIMRATMQLSFQALAELYDVGESAVQSAVHGRTFPDAGGPIEPPGTCENWTKRKPAKHGSTSMYAKGCRCEPCAEANRERCKDWRAEVNYGSSRRH